VSAHVDRLSVSGEEQLYNTLSAIFATASGAIDRAAVRDVFLHIGQKPTAADLAALDASLGLEDGYLEALLKAATRDQPGDLILTPLVSLFAALGALAARDIHFVFNPKALPAQGAFAKLAADLRKAFLADRSAAVRASAIAMLTAAGSTDSRVRHVVRVIGLAPGQAASIDAMRAALFDYLASPLTRLPRQVVAGTVIPSTLSRAADPSKFIARYAARLSAPQRASLRKAMTVALTEADADRLLNQSANTMRVVGLQRAAALRVHAINEAAKLAAWQMAERSGFLPTGQRREWVTAGDERVRHAHAEVPGMNPGGVLLDQPFRTPLGEFMTPPLEVNCRCKAVLVQR
jgi:hypothetical protein